MHSSQSQASGLRCDETPMPKYLMVTCPPNSHGVVVGEREEGVGMLRARARVRRLALVVGVERPDEEARVLTIFCVVAQEVAPRPPQLTLGANLLLSL